MTAAGTADYSWRRVWKQGNSSYMYFIHQYPLWGYQAHGLKLKQEGKLPAPYSNALVLILLLRARMQPLGGVVYMNLFILS